MIRWAVEWLIDCVVVMFLIGFGLFIAGIGFFFIHLKKLDIFAVKKYYA